MRVWLLLLLLLSPAWASVVLPDGTPVLLQNDEKLVSGETPEGSVILYKVERDVLGPQGEVLIPKGARAYGKCLKSSGSGFLSTAGELNISLDTVVAADNTTVPLRAVRADTGDDAQAGMIVGAVLLSPFFLFMSGDDVEIPAGTILSGYVNRDTVIPKPAPPRGALIARQVTLGTGPRLKKTDKLTFACLTRPEDPEAYVRLYVDNILVAYQKGALNAIVWDTTKNEKLTEKAAAVGEHTVVAEVTFANGQIVRSAPARITLFED